MRRTTLPGQVSKAQSNATTARPTVPLQSQAFGINGDYERAPISLEDLFVERGVGGAKVRTGRVFDEYLPQLQGIRGYRVYREMYDSDSTIGTIFTAIKNLLKAVEWQVVPPEGYEEDETAAEYAQFAREVFLSNDMEHTWGDFLSDVLSMLPYGWSWFEIVYKRRLGPEQADVEKKSQYDDGRIGIRKMVIRSQETLWKWDIEENGDVHGLWQRPPTVGDIRYIPKEKSLHFRTEPNRGNPEGRSILRNAYRAWYFLKLIEEVEAIAIERELNGLPVVYIPSAILNSSKPKDIALVNKYIAMVRDIKFNHQTGLVLESDPFVNEDGTYTDVPRVKFELLNSGGSRAIDTTKAKSDYKYDIARTAFADFAVLGSGERGSFALSKSKIDFFIRVLEGWANIISDTINCQEMERLWKLNGLPFEYLPKMRPGSVAPEDIEELTTALEKLSRTGMPLFPDEKLESHVRQRMGFPEREEDTAGDLVTDLNEE